ncbi:MAG: hypothetical protein CMM77_05130 [Rhodospirillaceae bacterium]|nr:hypothetical protein [Magnetovibrio sp.]MAY66490.1 hypothetical protein [Rhodospirillaceae bacterium]
MSTGEENPLSRWARLKRKSAKGEAVEEAPVEVARRGAAGPVAGTVTPPTAAGEKALATTADDAPVDADNARELTAEEAAYVETLPALEDLTPESDFSGFMDKRVPDFLRRQALRKLWLSDPAFSLIDGMHEYGEDYSMMAQLAAGASAYRPNEGGYAWRDAPKEKDEEDTVSEQTAEGDDAAAEAGQDEVREDGAEAEDMDESIADKASRVQDRGGSSVRLPTYTPNPYYQSPGQRHPAPETLPGPARALETTSGSDDDDLGEAEDDLA